MAAVYKSVSSSGKSKRKKPAEDEEPKSEHKYRQRVLILSSRGVTYRYAPTASLEHRFPPALPLTVYVATVIS